MPGFPGKNEPQFRKPSATGVCMSHKQEHDQRHEKHRQEKIQHEKQREAEWEKKPRRIHPGWFMGVGIVLIVMVVVVWTMIFAE
jgi:hypothetical protein